MSHFNELKFSKVLLSERIYGPNGSEYISDFMLNFCANEINQIRNVDKEKTIFVLSW